MKFQRDYELSIQMDIDSPDLIVIRPPFTVQFTINHATLISPNVMQIQIFNLKESTRKQIFQDFFNNLTFRKVIFKAGYKYDTPIIFIGELKQGYSLKQKTDWITYLECFDTRLSMMNGNSNFSRSSGTPLDDIYLDLIKDMPNVSGSYSSNLTATRIRGSSYVGNSWDLITNSVKSLFGFNVQNFIHNGQVYILRLTDYVGEEVLEINSDSGLLTTPQRSESSVTLKILFEPHAEIGQLIHVTSLESVVNGYYRIMGVSHQGIISEAVNGQCQTTLNLYLGLGKNVFNEVSLFRGN